MRNKFVDRDWIQIFSNVGVVAGLFFLGYQILQDRELKTAELLSAAFQDDQARHFTLMGENPAIPLTKMLTDQCLTDVEEAIVSIYFSSRLVDLRRNDYLEEVGLFPEQWTDSTGFSLPIWHNRYGLQALQDALNTPHISERYRSRIAQAVAEITRKVENSPSCSTKETSRPSVEQE